MSVREMIPPTQEMPQDKAEQFVAEIRQQREENVASEHRSGQNPSTASQGTVGNREDERETVNPSLAARGPVVRDPLPGQNRSEEPLENDQRIEVDDPFPEVGLALAGCAVRFAPRRAIRPCVDFRELNTRTVADQYPMQNVEDIFMRLGKAKYFTLIDLEKGFPQILMSELDREKTAFYTHKGLF